MGREVTIFGLRNMEAEIDLGRFTVHHPIPTGFPIFPVFPVSSKFQFSSVLSADSGFPVFKFFKFVLVFQVFL